jgi:ATP-dependent DNA helicase RecQ
MAEAQQREGIRALAYHAGWNPKDRILIHERFRDNQVDVMVATIAFGMGVDKGNIRYVIHGDMPRSIESLRSGDRARETRRRG